MVKQRTKSQNVRIRVSIVPGRIGREIRVVPFLVKKFLFSRPSLPPNFLLLRTDRISQEAVAPKVGSCLRASPLAIFSFLCLSFSLSFTHTHFLSFSLSLSLGIFLWKHARRRRLSSARYDGIARSVAARQTRARC